MMIKALLAWAGVLAVRAPILRSHYLHSDIAHDAINREQSIFSGTQALVHRSDRLTKVMDSDPTNIHRVNKGIDDMRAITAEVARRADR